MPRSDDPFDRLRAAIDELAAADAADLLAEARIEARARIRATLTDALAHSMLERLHEQLPEADDEAPSLGPAPASPAPPPAPTGRPRRTPDPPRRTTGRPRRSPDPPRRTPGAPAWYVYGVVSSDAELTESLPGVDADHDVALLAEGALAAVTSRVPLEEFDEERLREHLSDMAWVEATARAHEGVLERVQDQTTVIPMRMCTVYRTVEGVREMLRRETDAFDEALEHLAGKAEWGVKAFVSLDADGDGGETSTGAAYMERKRMERERRQRAIDAAEAAASTIQARLSMAADDANVIPLQRPEASGHAGTMVLNSVYLVANDARADFHEEVRALEDEFGPYGIEIIPTGPWPAYNFVPGTIGAAW